LIDVDKYIGIPYKHNGRKLEDGLDCWGLVLAIYKELDITIPVSDGTGEIDPYWYKKEPDRYWRFLQQLGDPVNLDQLQSMDIVYFALIDGTIISHAGVMLDQNRFIHTLQRRNCRVNRMDRFWRKKFCGARRLTKVNYVV